MTTPGYGKTSWTKQSARDHIAEAWGQGGIVAQQNAAEHVINDLVAERDHFIKRAERFECEYGKLRDSRLGLSEPARYRRITGSARIPIEHAQVWVLLDDLGERLQVRRVEDVDDERGCILPADWLERIVPPSIDDPVALPLEITDHDGYRLHIDVLHGNGCGDECTVKINGIHPTREQLADIARACWQAAQR